VIFFAIFGLASIENYSAKFANQSWLDFVSLLSYVFYVNGFAAIGIKFKKPPIVYATHALILLTVLSSAVFYAALMIMDFDIDLMNGIQTVIGIGISIAMVVLGWNILDLKSRLGKLAIWYGYLEIISALGIAYIFLPLGIGIELFLYFLGTILLYCLREGTK
jgi:hypothetical protein